LKMQQRKGHATREDLRRLPWRDGCVEVYGEAETGPSILDGSNEHLTQLVGATCQPVFSE
jgi:hypothetical protein